MILRPVSVVIVLWAMLSASCSVQKIALRSTRQIIDDSFIAINEEVDLTLAEYSAAASLKLIDGLLKTYPEDEQLLLKAAQGYIGYALAFVEEPERSALFFERGVDYALTIIELRRRHFEERWTHVDEVDAFLSTVDKTYIPALYWAANGWSGFINASRDDPDALADIPLVLALAEHVRSHFETYHYGGAHIILGSILGSFPEALGGEPEVARAHFERAISISDGRFLMAYVFFATTYAIQTQNRTLFEALLTKVLDAPDQILPEQNLANAVAKKRARELLGSAGEFFEI